MVFDLTTPKKALKLLQLRNEKWNEMERKVETEDRRMVWREKDWNSF